MEWNTKIAFAYAEGFGEGKDATLEEQLEAWSYIIKNGLHKKIKRIVRWRNCLLSYK